MLIPLIYSLCFLPVKFATWLTLYLTVYADTSRPMPGPKDDLYLAQDVTLLLLKKPFLGTSGCLSRLSVCLRLRSWFQGPGMESCIGILAQRGACFSLCLLLPLLVLSLSLSLTNKKILKKKWKMQYYNWHHRNTKIHKRLLTMNN